MNYSNHSLFFVVVLLFRNFQIWIGQTSDAALRGFSLKKIAHSGSWQIYELVIDLGNTSICHTTTTKAAITMAFSVTHLDSWPLNDKKQTCLALR